MVLDPAGENLHDIFPDPLELNSVETEVTATESPWQAGITKANGRACMLVFRKMLDSTRPKDKREYENCIEATASARNTTSFRGQSGRQSYAACLGGKTASLEGVPDRRSSCVQGQGSWHETWTCSLAWTSSSAGAVSGIKECVDCVGASVTQKCRKNSWV